MLRPGGHARRRGGPAAEAAQRGREPAALRDRPEGQLRAFDELDEAGLDLGIIYHSHTRSAPEPSQTDINLARYPDSLYLIVGVAGPEDDVRLWRIADGQVAQTPFDVVEG